MLTEPAREGAPHLSHAVLDPKYVTHPRRMALRTVPNARRTTMRQMGSAASMG
jgi:hypothetical protein